MSTDNLYFLTESSRGFEETPTIGSFRTLRESGDFDQIFESTFHAFEAQGIDLMRDINSVIKNEQMRGVYRDNLLGTLKTECAEMLADPDRAWTTPAARYEQTAAMFDNCYEDMLRESTRVGQLLPIKAIDLPVLVKQNLKLVSNDIMQTEVTKTPIIKKHLEQTYIVDANDKTKRWRYPQCFFDAGFKEAYRAGKGLPLTKEPQELPLDDFDALSLVDNADANKDNVTINIRVSAVVVADASDTQSDLVVTLPDGGMHVKLEDGMWQGGFIDITVPNKAGEDQNVVDNLFGHVDFRTNVINLVSQKKVVKAVIFDGYLSNESNERFTTFDYVREEREWKIEDGSRVNVPYSLEELEDAKALMNIDLYKKTYSNLAEYMAQQEDSQVLDYLDEMYEKYKGIEVIDKLGWNGFVTDATFDCDSTSITTALPSDYIRSELKFQIDNLITAICDAAKLDNMTFVIYGNPRYIAMLNPNINWVTRNGSRSNGVKLDYSYGVMNSNEVQVQVVSTKKVNAKWDADAREHRGLRIIPFPLDREQMTFKHYKYTSHILTPQDSAYRDPRFPGGSMTNLLGVSRYTNAAIQAIQARLNFANLERWVPTDI